MEQREILLGSAKNKLGANEDNFIDIEAVNSEKELPSTDDSYTVDAYKQYFKEKNDSQIYRLAFTVSPFCTNVLFNMLTEVVKNEGSQKCDAILWGGKVISGNTSYALNFKKTPETGEKAIRDTTYSHPSVGFDYHCGYNIFNNHVLRKKGLAYIEKALLSGTPMYLTVFNTIEDYVRDNRGARITDSLLKGVSGTSGVDVNRITSSIHLYQADTVYSFFESVSRNLAEKNGWVGFINPSMLPIPNLYTGGTYQTVNKCINNRNTGDFIDMYPDRTLFSFVPKYNSYRGRSEANWDYCITYPYSSATNNYLIESMTGNEVNGILCSMLTDLSEVSPADMPSNIVFKSHIKNNLSEGDYIYLSFIYPSGEVRKTDAIRVVAVENNLETKEYMFSVHSIDVFGEVVDTFNLDNKTEEGGDAKQFNTVFEVRLSKCDNGAECQYYLRKFKPIKTLSGSLGKLAFSQNAYSDQVAQIVFTEDIDTSSLRDNLNRPISELYLTIIKRNAGHNLWYEQTRTQQGTCNFSSSTIEFSHCFGYVSAGFDLSVDSACSNYNVHRIHSVGGLYNGIPASALKLDSDITIEKAKEQPDYDFYGDIVEFSPYRMEETVLEDVYFRFNTAQRETVNQQYSSFTYDEIIKDDYDSGTTFLGTSSITLYLKSQNSNITRANIQPEGYYYKAHYKLKIRDFKEETNEGYHIKVGVTSAQKLGGSQYKWRLNTKENYYFQSGSTVYLYDLSEDKTHYELVNSGICENVNGPKYTVVDIRFYKPIATFPEDGLLFRRNTEMPEYAFNLHDGSGKYIWRDILPFEEEQQGSELYDSQFTNGAHYHHKNIMFYLKRQDPKGEYGLQTQGMGDFIIGNESKDISYADYTKEVTEVKC